MISVNSLSGGGSSSLMAENYPADYDVFSLVCLDDVSCAPTDKSIIRYVNDKLEKYHGQYGEFIATAEDDKTLYAMMDLEQLIGREITWVRGESYDSVIDKRYQRVQLGNLKWLPSWARRYCTEEMKLLPIFLWWFHEIGEKVNMRIGFRYDEFDRLERFFNNSDPTHFKIPISCRTYGQKQQVHKIFNRRFCSFPLIKDGIRKHDVMKYWKENGYIGGDLFQDRRQITFPAVSNCVGCFHKKEETLAAMCELHPDKMKWFAKQETLGMGTWLDSRKLYSEIFEKRKDIAKEVLIEIQKYNYSCDSGGCTE
jgi:hypothetical protein